ncbi:hypothetical protein KR044_003878 [Drosophila immigrans]|nr:hypothetical protein KR044_003878 [Drosophila immigrans]
MQLNLGSICSLPLLLMLLLSSLGVALSEPRHRTPGPFDTRPSPYNPNPPRGGPVF